MVAKVLRALSHVASHARSSLSLSTALSPSKAALGPVGALARVGPLRLQRVVRWLLSGCCRVLLVKSKWCSLLCRLWMLMWMMNLLLVMLSLLGLLLRMLLWMLTLLLIMLSLLGLLLRMLLWMLNLLLLTRSLWGLLL